MGSYLRILQEGDIGAGDSILVTERPQHGITLGGMVEALHDQRKAAALREVSGLPAYWQHVARGR
jgi:MOSC domain-containing protein YiiM